MMRRDMPGAHRRTRAWWAGLVIVGMWVGGMPLGSPPPAGAEEAAPAPQPGGATERWYELLRNNQKAGYFQVVWAPSTWKDRKTLRDTTTQVTRSVRNMSGVMDVFESTYTVELERDPDGTLWWQRVRVEEAGRATVEELTWTGTGYRHVAGIEGEEPRVTEISLDAPAMLDAESVMGHRIREGTAAVGTKLPLPLLDVRARAVRKSELEVLAVESIEDEHGEDVKTWKVRERHPESGSAQILWLDAHGAFVRIKGDGGTLIRRVTADQAKDMPTRPAEMRITTPSSPTLERVFSADRLRLDLHLQGDPDRELPVFPDSPWSRMLSLEGDHEAGWVARMELRAYDSEAKSATIPVSDKAFERDLEPTVLMQSTHPRIRKMAQDVIGEETDARKAAWLLSRHVFEYLKNKRSPDVAQASALEIVELRCGDCSEHCLLFVTLCRAAGIPARRCSGYVNIGSMWGAHAWAEIWTGQWIGADPTTGEIGAGARYLFFGYSDRPDSYPGVVSSRARGRMRFVATEVVEGEAVLPLAEARDHRVSHAPSRSWLHAPSGLEVRNVPEDWQVQLSGSGTLRIRAPDMRADVHAGADQGYTWDYWSKPMRRMGQVETTFGGVPALVMRVGEDRRLYRIFSRRRMIRLQIVGGSSEDLARLEQCLTPGLQETPAAWPPPEPAAEDE